MSTTTDRGLVRRPPREARKPRTTTTLAIRARSGRVLTAGQRYFNRVARRVTALERKVDNSRERLEMLLRRFGEKVAPVEERLARSRIELARELAAAHGRLALRSTQRDTLRLLLLDLYDQAFQVIEPDEEAIRLHDEWSRVSWHDEARERTTGIKEHLADRFRSTFGFEPDVPDDDTPESLVRFRRVLAEQARRAQAEQRDRAQQNRRLREFEEKRRKREAAVRSALREIYLSLAKALHPDTVADAAERKLREQFMKEAVAAYRQGNVASLLRLELRWGSRDPSGLGSLDDDALALLVDALQQQAIALEREVEQQVFDPRFAPIAPVAELPERAALAGLDDRADWLREQAVEVERMLAQVKACRSKNALSRLVRDFLLADDFDSVLDP